MTRGDHDRKASPGHSNTAIAGAGFSVCLLGLLVLTGWYTHSTALIQILPAFVPMQYNTALGFLLCGLGLVFISVGRSGPASICGGFAGLLGLLTLIEYLVGLDLHIDQLLMSDHITVQTSHPGRMAPNTALCFALTGTVLVAMSRSKSNRWSPTMVALWGSTITALGLVALCGYLVGLPTTYGWGRLTRMAIHTAVGFIALGSGVIIYAWRTQSVREAGIPEWLHIPSGISSVTISICLWQALLTGGAPAPLPAVGLGVGLVMSALITSMLHFVIVSRKRAAQYRDVNSRLKAQIGERQHAEGELRTLANTLDQRVSERTKDLRDSQTAALNMMEDAQDARREAEIAEQEQGRLIEELKAKNTEMEQFTYTVSHDLKSPLITIQGFLGLLERDVAANDQTRIKSDMEHIQVAGNRMSQLLDELLELSRVGRLLNDPQAISLTDLSTQAVELVAGRIAEAGVEVVIQPGMPTVTGDVVRLREVVQNLLDNAVKYLGDQPNPRIAITALRNGDETTIRVSDNGIGIDPKYHAKIFGLFDQLNKSSEGVGMGLPLVKRIVEIHDGRVWVESAGPGSGSTFCFTLPDHAMIDSEDSAQDDVHAIDSNEYAQGAPS